MDFRTAGLTWVGGKTVSYSSTLEIFVLPANLKKKKKKSTLPKFTPQSSLTDLEAFNSFLGLPKYLADKESACQGRRHRYNSWVRKIPWSRNPLLYSCLDNPMDKGTWWATVQGVTLFKASVGLQLHDLLGLRPTNDREHFAKTKFQGDTQVTNMLCILYFVALSVWVTSWIISFSYPQKRNLLICI